MAALDFLTERGFSARKVDMRIRVSPASKLTDEVRRYVEAHRQELLLELPEYPPQTADATGHAVEVNRPLPRPHLVLVERPQPPKPKDCPNAASASPEWRKARDQYLNHSLTCRSCYAPSARYCPTGADLRATYDNTPMEPAQ